MTVLGKKLPNQILQKTGKLSDLWAEFKDHSKVYMAITRLPNGRRTPTVCAWIRSKIVIS